jgi:hypothetical protein
LASCLEDGVSLRVGIHCVPRLALIINFLGKYEGLTRIDGICNLRNRTAFNRLALWLLRELPFGFAGEDEICISTSLAI